MDVKNLVFSTKEQVEPGEELLHKEYRFKNAQGVEENMIVGVDGGSTQSRGLLLSKSCTDIEKVIVIPSIYSPVPDDRDIKPKSGKLYDLLDTTINNNSVEIATIVKKVRIVRGTKFKDSNFAELRIDSSTQKIDNPAFYNNILDCIGYTIAMNYGEAIPTVANIYLGIALPPDDISSKKNIEVFRKNLIGSFTWMHQASGVKITINIKDLVECTEPEAFIKAYYAVSEEEVPGLTLHIEAGGRSIGVEVLENGQNLESASRTLPYGGNQLLDSLGNIYIQEKGGRLPNHTALSRAIVTGQLKDGASSIDVVEFIKKAKSEFAKQIMADIIAQVFDQQKRISLKDIESVSVSGKLFAMGNYKVSIATFLAAEFKAKTPNTIFKHIEKNYIPLGLLFSAYQKFGGVLEVEEKASATVPASTEVELEMGNTEVAATQG